MFIDSSNTGIRGSNPAPASPVWRLFHQISLTNWNKQTPMRFEVHTAASMKMTVFRDTLPCSPTFQRFILHPSSWRWAHKFIVLIMEAVSISEMSVYFHETIRSNILEQTFSNCGTRTTIGTPITVLQYTGLVRNNQIINHIIINSNLN
jgi:hypothetical protein